MNYSQDGNDKTSTLEKYLTGATVTDIYLKIGNMMQLIVKRNADDSDYMLWLYSVDWAITINDKEVASSDNSDAIQIGNYRDLLGRFVTRVVRYNHDEMHIDFNGFARLEVWRLEKDDRDPMVIFYRDEEKLCKID